eukprot:5443644-Pleurochrysis_carterae.AAC.1
MPPLACFALLPHRPLAPPAEQRHCAAEGIQLTRGSLATVPLEHRQAQQLRTVRNIQRSCVHAKLRLNSKDLTELIPCARRAVAAYPTKGNFISARKSHTTSEDNVVYIS